MDPCAEIDAWSSEGFDSADLKDAKPLLNSATCQCFP
jgi:hypothetical protein